MTEYTFNQLVDVTQVRQLLESHHTLTGMAYGVFDTDENNLIAVGWQDICVRFHRVNPVSCARCRESDAYIKAHLRDFEGDCIEYRCKNGMIDVAMPIIINGEHMATFFAGQFFYDDDRPETEYFRTQAETLGFDSGEYLNALERVPVLSCEHVCDNILFLRDMVKVLAEIGLKNLTIIERSNHIQATQYELELAANVFEQGRQGIVITDREGTILRINGYFTELTGFTPEEAIGKTPRVLKSHRQDDSFYAEMWASLIEKGEWNGEIWNRKKNGEGFASLLSITSVRDENNEILYFIGINEDITEQKLSSERINRLAHYDILTNLPNRRLFNERFSQSLQQAELYKRQIALLLLDIDNFKKVNDTLGHHAGDVLLQTVSKRIVGSLGKVDTVARLGGDEFAVMLENVRDPSDVERLAQRIIEAVSAPIRLEETQVYVGVSIGACIYPLDGHDSETLIRNADNAMYRAKAAGKNRCQFFDAEMAIQAARRLAMENDLREAIENELFLVYQPQADVSGSRIIGVEALVRWRHPKQGLINPVDFIHIAEESGLIHRLGEWVLDTACRQAARWHHEKGISLRVAVNVSAIQLNQQSFFNAVEQIIRESRLPSSLLELELTESMVMSRVEETVRSFRRLKEMDVTIAIDDFGTGYSSLSYLKKLPIDRLKIDRSFISDIPQNREDIAITRTIIAMARSLNLQVIAEGVETDSQLDFLRGEGCDEFQGYLLSKPLSPDELERLLERRHNTVSYPPNNPLLFNCSGISETSVPRTASQLLADG